MSNENMANYLTDVPSAIAELLAVNKQLEQELELLKLERDEFKKYSTMWFDKKNELEQELQKTREQLEKRESALNNYAICDDVGTVARRYFKDKQSEALEGDVNYQAIEQLKESAK